MNYKGREGYVFSNGPGTDVVDIDFLNAGGISTEFPNTDTEQKSYCGRLWDYVRPTSFSDGIRKVSSLCSIAASATLAYFGVRSFQTSGLNIQNACLFGGTAGAAFGAGASLSSFQPLRDTLNSWSYEVGQVFNGLYDNNGSPRDNGGWQRTDAVRYGFATGFSFLSAYFITQTVNHIVRAPYDEDFLPNIDIETGSAVLNIREDDSTPLKAQEPLSLFIESRSSFSPQFFLEQGLKLAAATGIIATYFFVPEAHTPELFNLGAFLGATVPGAILSTVWNSVRENIIEDNKRAILHTVDGIQIPSKILWLRRVEKVSQLVSHATIGLAFAFKSPYAFMSLGLVSGWAKIINMREFERITPKENGKGPISIDHILQPARDFMDKKGLEKLEPLAKTLALAGAVSWYVYGLSDPTEDTEDRLKIALLFSSALIAYLTTRVAAKHFSPGKSPSYINSLYFYLVHHTSNTILPYLLIRSVQRITNHTHSNFFKELLSYLAFAFLGFAAGQNRAEQGLKSHRIHRRPGPITEYYSSFLLANIAQGHFA